MLTKMDCFGVIDAGRVRSSNQDHFLIADLNKSLRVYSTSLDIDDETRLYGGSQGKLLLVADGMGGEAEGERASSIAVDQLATYVLNSLSWCYRLEESSEDDFAEHLKDALKSCQESIKTVANQRSETRSMGTMTMLYIVWPRALVVHVGDSRCYLLRGDRLEQITVDHTLASLLAKRSEQGSDEVSHSLLCISPSETFVKLANVMRACPLSVRRARFRAEVKPTEASKPASIPTFGRNDRMQYPSPGGTLGAKLAI